MSEACHSCQGQCCYNIVVNVTPFDIARIGSAQSLEPLQIVEPRELSPSEGPPPEIGAQIDETGRLFGLVLRKSIVEPSACQFLITLDSEHKRCGIYPDRPRVCAVYPFAVRQGSVDLRADVTCDASNWNMARLDYGTLRRELAVYSAEWHAYARIAQAWNTGVIGRRCLPSFEGFASFANEAAVAVLLSETPDTELLTRWDEAELPQALRRARDAWLGEVSSTALRILPRSALRDG